MKMLLKLIGWIIAVLFITICLYLIYLVLPDSDSADHKIEILNYEQTSIHSSINKTVSKKDPKSLSEEEHQNIEKELSADCRDQVIDFKRMNVKDIKSKYKEDGILLTDSCSKEIRHIQKFKNDKTIDDICDFPRRLIDIMGKLDKVMKNEKIKDIDKESGGVLAICNLGANIYRPIINEYLNENLEEIDNLSRYFYLKMMESFETGNLKGSMTKKMIKSLPYIEEILHISIRYIFMGTALKEIHENEAVLDDLRFEDSLVRQKLLEVIEKNTQERD